MVFRMIAPPTHVPGFWSEKGVIVCSCTAMMTMLIVGLMVRVGDGSGKWGVVEGGVSSRERSPNCRSDNTVPAHPAYPFTVIDRFIG